MKKTAPKYEIGEAVFTYTEGRVMKRTVMKIIEEATRHEFRVYYHLSRTSSFGGEGSIQVHESDVFSCTQDLANKILNAHIWDETIPQP